MEKLNPLLTSASRMEEILEDKVDLVNQVKALDDEPPQTNTVESR
jgi:hypothetical protein